MPFSFTEIEHKKSSVIKLVFVALCLLYFLFGVIIYIGIKLIFYGVYAIGLERLRLPFHPAFLSLNFTEIGVISSLALVLAVGHWTYVTHNLINRILAALQAEVPNPQDGYHKLFLNILEELSIATGGKKFEGYVIPTMALNACAASDFQNRAIIALTEGILAKLSRSQIEAVVAHEAGHILRGDSLEASITVSLFDLLTEFLQNYPLPFRLSWYSLRAGLVSLYVMLLVIIIYILLQITRLAGFILNMFMSRQREFRADAISTRLTRNPQALAEALYIISHSWHGADAPGENLDPLFIVKNRFSALDEVDSIFSELFSTHPPIKQRLSILLDMAHADHAALEAAIKKSANKPRTLVSYLPKIEEDQWLFHKEGQWAGPYTFKEILTLEGIVSDMLVKKMGAREVSLAWQDPQIMEALKIRCGNRKSLRPGWLCPRCHSELNEMSYESAILYHCLNCQGNLVKEADLARIIAREEAGFSQAIRDKAHKLQEQSRKFQKPRSPLIRTIDILQCPRCRSHKAGMLRRFFSLMYRVEIDKCCICGIVWFDKDELEMLQFLIEEAKGSAQS